MRSATEKQRNRNAAPLRRGKSALLTPKGKREALKDLELLTRLQQAALRADAGPEGTNVTDMSSEEFVAFLRRG